MCVMTDMLCVYVVRLALRILGGSVCCTFHVCFSCVRWLFLECVLCVALCVVCSGCVVLRASLC